LGSKSTVQSSNREYLYALDYSRSQDKLRQDARRAAPTKNDFALECKHLSDFQKKELEVFQIS